MVTQADIAKAVGLDISSVNKILNRREGPVFRKKTIREVFRVAKELGYEIKPNCKGQLQTRVDILEKENKNLRAEVDRLTKLLPAPKAPEVTTQAAAS